MKDKSENVREPNKEVIYDYPTGVGSGEDEMAAVRVEMVEITPNPAYGTVTCGKEHVRANDTKITIFLSKLLFSGTTTPDMVDEYDCELPELNDNRTYVGPNVDDEYLTEVVEMTPNPAYGTVTCGEEHD